MLCPNCETENRDGAKFCDKCGFPLNRLRGALYPDGEGDASAAPSEPVASESRVSADEDIPEAAAEPEAIEGVQPDDLEGEPDEPGADDAHDAAEPDSSWSDADESPAEDTADDAGEPEPDSSSFDSGQDLEDTDASVEDSVADDAPVPDESAPSKQDGTPGWDGVDADDDYKPTPYSSPEPHRADFAGFDRHAEEFNERLADEDFEIPDSVYHDGGTMQMPRVGADDEPQTKEYIASDVPKDKKEGAGVNVKGILASVLGACVIVAVVLFGSYQMQLWGGKVVPNVTGMTEADATSVLSANGFEMRSMKVKSDDTEGLVILTDPSAGWRVDEGSEVVVHVATSRIIPDVVGKPKAEAGRMLAQEGYENVRFEMKNSETDMGTVLSIDPDPGTREKSTAEVVVTVAQPYTVPDVAKFDFDSAVAAIEKSEYATDVEYVDTKDYPEGTVIGTDPPAGTELPRASVVVIKVAEDRSTKLEELTRDYLAPGSEVDIDGTPYVIDKLESVNYIGDNTVEYTATGRSFVRLLGEPIYSIGTTRFKGTVVFDENDQVASQL